MREPVSDDAALTRALGGLLLATLGEYLGAFRDCRTKTSVAHIHDLRVATRRLRVIVALCKGADPGGVVTRMRRLLRPPFRGGGALRDLQLASRMLKQWLASYPECSRLQRAVLKRRARERRRIRHLFRAKRAARLTALAAELAGSLHQAAADPLQARRVVVALSHRLARMRNRFLAAPPIAAEPSRLHRLRIALKDLRYALEMLAPILVPAPAPDVSAEVWASVASLQLLQRRLGEVTDLGMLINQIGAFRAEHPKRGLPLGRLEKHLRRERAVQLRQAGAELGRLQRVAHTFDSAGA
jgi:CHAD domain-containing protein